MSALLAVAGGALLVVTLLDVAATTLTVGVAHRPLSGRLSALMWRSTVRLLGGRHRVLALVGPSLLAALVLGWAGLLWLGWGLVFLAAPDLALLVADTEVSATAWERLYFTGYTMTTLGPGGIEVTGTWWQFLEVLTSLTGLILTTLGITFVLSVVNGVVDKRRLAADLSTLGQSPQQLLRQVFDGTSWQRVEPILGDLTTDVHDIAQQHLAYPVLHYFHSTERVAALAPSLAVVDEALTMLIAGKDGDGIDGLVLQRFRAGSRMLLDTLRSAFIEADEQPPRMPSRDVLTGLATSVADQSTWEDRLDSFAERRATLEAFVRSDGWDWDTDVYGTDSGQAPR